MSIRTIFAQVSCSDLESSTAWYEQLFGMPPTRCPMKGLNEWHVTDGAELQLFEAAEHAGYSALTLCVLPLEPERARLKAAGLTPGEIEAASDVFIMRMRDPDANQVVLASAERN